MTVLELFNSHGVVVQWVQKGCHEKGQLTVGSYWGNLRTISLLIGGTAFKSLYLDAYHSIPKACNESKIALNQVKKMVSFGAQYIF